MSLPLGLMSSLLLIFVPALVSASSGVGSIRAGLVLLAMWGFGLAIQASIAQIWMIRGRHEIVTVTIGGVWTTVPPLSASDDSGLGKPGEVRAPSLAGAIRTIMLWLTIVAALGAAAMICFMIDRSWESSVDRPWMAAGWMFAIQGIWQLLPVPQSLGRVGWSILVGWCSPSQLKGPRAELTTNSNAFLFPDDRSSEQRDAAIGPDAVMSTRRTRWWMVGFALVTLVVGVLAIQWAGFSTQSGGRPLPVFAGVVLLSMWLFASSRNEDLFAIQLTLSENGEIGRFQDSFNPALAWRNAKAAKLQRARDARLKAALVRERDEASDASRVDEILQRLHEKGRESLSADERDLLGRVSAAIRRERQRDK